MITSLKYKAAMIAVLVAPIIAMGTATPSNGRYDYVTARQSVAIGTTSANSKAALDVVSTSKGVLLPRMSTTQQNAITSPTEGLIVYDNVLHHFAVYNGSAWKSIFDAGAAVPIASGGTGQTSQTAAFDALSPLTTAGDTLTFGSGHNVRVGTVLGDLGKFWTSGGGFVSNSWSNEGSVLTNLNASNVGLGTLSAARMPALTGDVTTSAGSVATTVAKIQGTTVSSTAPTSGQVLAYNSSATRWEPQLAAVGSGGTGISSGTSGGLLYFSGSSTIASSSSYATSKVLLGGGSGAAPGSLSCSDGQIVKWSSGVPSCSADATGASSWTYRSVTTTDTPTNGTDNILQLSGASFTVTLPTASGVSGQFYIIKHSGTSLTQVYTLNTTSAQTISCGGTAYTSGQIALYTKGETFGLYSDGSGWNCMWHYSDTAPTYVNNITLSATSAYVFSWTGNQSITAGDTYSDGAGHTYAVTTTSNVTTGTFSGTGTPASTGTLNSCVGTCNVGSINWNSRTITGQPVFNFTPTYGNSWWRSGRFAYYNFNYGTSASGATNGSGDYIWYLPAGLNVDTNIVPAFITGIGSTLLSSTTAQYSRMDTWCSFGNGTAYVEGNSCSAYPYSATSFRIAMFYWNGSTDASGNQGGGLFGAAASAYDMNVTIKIPISGWIQ